MTPKDQYHHGDLRTALLDAAEAALNAEPEREPSVRSLAAAIGVSATAPQAHFKTKSDLIEALATRGFDKLGKAAKAASEDPENPRAMLEAMAEAYLRFGMDNPGLFKAMFTNGVSLDNNPTLFTASRESYALIQGAIGQVFPGISTKERNRRALTAWSVIHGLTALTIDGRIQDDIIDDRSPGALAKIAAALVMGTSAD